jgi:hypothetical protein
MSMEKALMLRFRSYLEGEDFPKLSLSPLEDQDALSTCFLFPASTTNSNPVKSLQHQGKLWNCGVLDCNLFYLPLLIP